MAVECRREQVRRRNTAEGTDATDEWEAGNSIEHMEAGSS